MVESHTQVLVIGAGPTGLFFAGELARHGVKARIIDKCQEPHTQTRATGIQPAALEAFHRAGVVDAFLEAGVPVKGLRILDEECREAFVSQGPPLCSPFGWTISMAQWQTEQILTEHLATFGIQVERGLTAEEISVSEKGAKVECVDAAGERMIIHCDYLVGAGGAHSVVRGALRENLDGITYPLRYFVADVRSQGILNDRNLLTVAISQAGMLMVAELPGGRTLMVTDLPEGDISGKAPTLEDARAAIALHLKKPFEISDLRWASIYHTHRRLAPRFSDGRCFLAGDAAHICSPLGGEGMNSGILDAATLAWMLGAVLRRGGTKTILDAYHFERHEAAAHVLASSHAMREFYYGLIEQVRNGQPLVAPEAHPKVVSPDLLGLSIEGSPIVGSHGRCGDVKPGARFAERTRLSGTTHHLLVYRENPDLSEFHARWGHVVQVLPGLEISDPELAGVPSGGAVLVRPDGYIGFQMADWSEDGRRALDEFLAKQFSPLN